MENIILETKNLTKRYGQTYALDNVNISLLKGHIYGFIGENGAGKTTLLRIITGLSFPTTGELIIGGKSGREDLEQARRFIGSTIEEPSLHPNYTVWENLELQRILAGNPDKGRIEELLQMVGLLDAKGKKVRNLSIGMKQSLGIAFCLIGQPKILVLDEPVNGLDPKRIAELREMLKRLSTERNITILISSHILSELYLFATDYLIIHKGKILDKITTDELDKRCRKYIAIRMDNTPVGLTIIEKELHTNNYKVLEDGMVHLYQTENIDFLADVLRKHNIRVTHLALSEETLEEYYLTVTGGENHV